MQGSSAAQAANYASSLAWARRFKSVKGSLLTDWVSTFRGGKVCSVVEVLCGTFNLNCRIRFRDDLEWIVRFPVSGRAMGDVDAKVRHEVAVMKLIRSRTTIPVPEVVASGPGHACTLGLGPFIIMQYIDGRVLARLMEIPGHLPNGKILRDDVDLSVLEHIYRQVARFLLELMTVELSTIGTIAEDADAFYVASSPVSVKMNDIERQDGISLTASSKPFKTTTEFFEHILALDMEHLSSNPESVTDENDARKKYGRLRKLLRMLPNFVDAVWDTGPFMLRCEGMRFGNMLVDDSFNITAVLDWEWAYSAPKQMFHSPPRWLTIRRPMHWNTKPPWESACVAQYLDCFNIFIKILAEEEEVRAKTESSGANEVEASRLSCLMRNSLNDGLLWFHELLLAPTAYDSEDIWEKVEAMMARGDEDQGANNDDVKNFVDLKMEQMQVFHDQQIRWNEHHSRPDRSLPRTSISEILRTC